MEFSSHLHQYVSDLHNTGRNYTQTVVALAVEQGYALPIAHRIVEAVLHHKGNDNKLFYDAPGEERILPDIDTTAESVYLDLGDIRAEVVFEQLAPRVVLLDNFMTPAECDAACQQATTRMRRSEVMSRQSEGSVLEINVRDADSASLKGTKSKLAARIERRIQTLTSWPETHGEPLLVQRYKPQGKYLPHFDFFDLTQGLHQKTVAGAGQRLATLIVYLREPEAGGATYLANLGMRIKPRKGSALFFSYPDPSQQSGTLHAGDPVLAGEKWILTKWLRERSWVSNASQPPSDAVSNVEAV